QPRSYSAHPRSAPRGATGHSNRIHRSQAAKDDFMRKTGHPHGWPGHVVDHVVPLACGGADAPSNMQWQTVAEAKAKDKVERIGCGSIAAPATGYRVAPTTATTLSLSVLPATSTSIPLAAAVVMPPSLPKPPGGA